jgi:hypothetical protein
MATWRQAILLAMALLLVSGGSCQIQREPGRPIGKVVTTPPSPNLPPKEWQPPTLLRTSSNEIKNIRVAVSSRGDAIVSWIEFPGKEIRANRFTQKSSLRLGPLCCWNDPNQTQHVGDSDTEEADPILAMDGQGRVLAVWNNKQDIMVNRYPDPQGTGGWPRSPESIKHNSDFVHAINPPRLAMSDSGLAIVVWQEKISRFFYPIGSYVGVSAIYAKVSSQYGWTFPTGSGTELNAPITSPTSFQLLSNPPQVAMNPQGSASMAVWGDGDIYYNYQAALNRGQRIGPGFSGEDPHIALDGQGNGLAVWTSFNRIYAGRFTPASGGQWEGQPQEISAPQTGASDARVALQQASPDRPGQGAAVWAQGGNIFVKRFDPGRRLGGPAPCLVNRRRCQFAKNRHRLEGSSVSGLDSVGSWG